MYFRILKMIYFLGSKKSEFISGNSTVCKEEEKPEVSLEYIPKALRVCYEGEWSDASQSFHHYDPGVYRGEVCLEGWPEGYGIMRYTNLEACDVLLLGVWSDINPDFGVVYHTEDGKVEAGFLVGGPYLMSGLVYDPSKQAIYREIAGRKYIGPAKHLYFPSGAEYFGETKDNYAHGEGIMIYADGSCYWGQMYKSYRDGVGSYIPANGRLQDGEWHMGDFLG